MNIVLIGPNGAGKTTIGPILARKLNMRYVSIGGEVKKLAGVKWISEIRKNSGKEKEIELLRKVISELSKKDGQVIDCGVVIDALPEKEKFIKPLGTIVLLTADVKILWERIKNSKERLFFLSPKNPFEDLKRRIRENKEFYSAVNLEIDTSNASPEETADKIKKLLLKK